MQFPAGLYHPTTHRARRRSTGRSVRSRTISAPAGPIYNNRPPGSRPATLCRFMATLPENEQKPPLNRLSGQSVPTYRPATAARFTARSVRFMAIPVRPTVATIYRAATNLLVCPKPAKIGKTNLPKS